MKPYEGTVSSDEMRDLAYMLTCSSVQELDRFHDWDITTARIGLIEQLDSMFRQHAAKGEVHVPVGRLKTLLQQAATHQKSMIKSDGGGGDDSVRAPSVHLPIAGLVSPHVRCLLLAWRWFAEAPLRARLISPRAPAASSPPPLRYLRATDIWHAASRLLRQHRAQHDALRANRPPCKRQVRLL